MGVLGVINAAYLYTYALVWTPWFLSHFLFDVLLTFLPLTRPASEWSMMQAARMRLVKLVLLYWSLTRAGNRLSLRDGRERNRFEVLRPASSKFYRGVLSDPEVQPVLLGTTWTPSRPPPPDMVQSDLIVDLHFHGGGFVIGNGRDEDTGYLAQTLIRRMGCTHVCTPQYRLASGKNGRFPAPVQDALTAYLWLLKDRKIPASQIILSGDSAGANIALGLLRYIQEYGHGDGIPYPAAVALWSPWVDVSAALTQDMSLSPNYGTDYLNSEFGRWGATTISGSGIINPMSPYLSPLHHPFKTESSIPLFIHAGEREVLCEDIKNFHRLSLTHGWKAHLVVSSACPHDIILLGPRIGFGTEAAEAADKAGAFLASTTTMKLRRMD